MPEKTAIAGGSCTSADSGLGGSPGHSAAPLNALLAAVAGGQSAQEAGHMRAAARSSTPPAAHSSAMQPTSQQQQYVNAVAAAAAAAGGLGTAQAQRLLAAAAAAQQQQQHHAHAQHHQQQQQPQAAALAAAAAAARSKAPDAAADARSLLAQLDPSALSLLLNGGHIPQGLFPGTSAAQARPKPIAASDVPLSAALETQAVLRRLSANGGMRSNPQAPASLPPQHPPQHTASLPQETTAAFAQLEKLFGPKVAASILAVHAPSLITKSPPPQASHQPTDAQSMALLRALMGGNLANVPIQSLQNLQNNPQLSGLANYSSMMQGAAPNGSNAAYAQQNAAAAAAAAAAAGNGGNGHVNAVRADLHAALIAGIQSGRVPASMAAQIAAGNFPQGGHYGGTSAGGPTVSGCSTPSKRKQSPLMSMSSMDRERRGSGKRHSDGPATSVARRAGPEEPPMLLTPNDLRQPGNTPGSSPAVPGHDRRGMLPTDSPMIDVGNSGGEPAPNPGKGGVGKVGSSGALAPLGMGPGAPQQPAAAVSGDALKILMSALRSDATPADRERATAELARMLERPGATSDTQHAQHQSPNAGAVQSQAPAATAAPMDLTGDTVMVKHETAGSEGTQGAEKMQKPSSNTEDELQAAALLISLKDSSTPGAAAGGPTASAAPSASQKAEPSTGQPWPPASGVAEGSQDTAAKRHADALARPGTAGSPGTAPAPHLQAAVSALTGAAAPPADGSAANRTGAAAAPPAPHGDLGSPIAKALLNQLMGGYKDANANAAVAAASAAPNGTSPSKPSAGGDSSSAPPTVPGLPPGVSVMCKESEEAGRPAVGDLGRGAAALPPGGSLPGGLSVPSSGIPASLPLVLASPQGAENAGASSTAHNTLNAAHTMSLLRSLVAGGALDASALPGFARQVSGSNGAARPAAANVSMGTAGGDYWKVDQSQLQSRANEGR